MPICGEAKGRGSVGKLPYAAASKQSNPRKWTSSLVSFTDERMEHQRGYNTLLINTASKQRHKHYGAIPILCVGWDIFIQIYSFKKIQFCSSVFHWLWGGEASREVVMVHKGNILSGKWFPSIKHFGIWWPTTIKTTGEKSLHLSKQEYLPL